MMDDEEKILYAFRRASELGMKRLSFQTLIAMTEIPKQKLNKKLDSMQKYEQLRKTTATKKHKLFFID
jgi:hypothetical protein